MIRDPLNPKKCVEAAKAFDGIALLLGQYVEANQRAAGIPTPVFGEGKPVRYKVILFCELLWQFFLFSTYFAVRFCAH